MMRAIRLVLGALLLVGVYSETGKWTTIFISLFWISSELNSLVEDDTYEPRRSK